MLDIESLASNQTVAQLDGQAAQSYP